MDERIVRMSNGLQTNTVLTEGVDRKMNDVLQKLNTRETIEKLFKWLVTTIITAGGAYAAFLQVSIMMHH